MRKMILSVDEKWPVYELELAEEGQETNCEVSDQFYRHYLQTQVAYKQIQNEMRYTYEKHQREVSERISRESVPKGCVPMYCQYDPIIITS